MENGQQKPFFFFVKQLAAYFPGKCGKLRRKSLRLSLPSHRQAFCERNTTRISEEIRGADTLGDPAARGLADCSHS